MLREDLGTTCLEIQIVNRDEFEKLVIPDKGAACICVYNNSFNARNIFDADGHAKCDIIGLNFQDVEEGEPGCMNMQQSAKIARFVLDNIRRIDKLIVSCDGGTCRSPAIAAAIMVKLGLDDFIIWRNGKFVPNMHVFKTTLRGLFMGNIPDIDIAEREAVNLKAWKELNDI